MDGFEKLGVSPEILKGLKSIGYTQPFPIQDQAIPPLLSGRDVIGQAKAGSGKTAAFGIPLLTAVNPADGRVQALVLAPTRELAVQITRELRKMGAHTGATAVTIYGGEPIVAQIEALKRGASAVVGTPGRVIDHLMRRTLRLDSVRYAVIDEADVMLDMGFIDDVEFILKSVNEDSQLSLFSATMPPRIVELAERFMREPVHVFVDGGSPSPETLDQYYARVERPDKLELLLQVLKSEKGSAVVFCRTRHGTTRLARELDRRFINVTQLHGDLTQNQRDRSMDLFRRSRADVLVATDVAARGIDVRQVGCVVNFDVPEDPMTYFHRVGRTARAGDLGKAFTFVSTDEGEDFERIMRLSKAPIKPMRPEDGIRLAAGSPGRGGRRKPRRRPYQRGGRERWSRWRR